MSIKIKHILLLVLIVLLSIIVLIVISYKKSTSEYNNNVEAENVDKNYDMYYARGGDGWLEVCYLVAQKNGNWDNLFLSENFRKKYNEKDGILGDIQYDNIEYRPYAGSNEDYYFKEDMTYFVITQGKSKTVYIFHPVYLDNNQLDDVQFSEIIQLYDKNGKKFVIEGEIIDKEGFEYSFFKLCMGGDDEKRIAVTDNFHKKYPYFLDIFEHYSPLTFNHIEFIPDKSSWEKKEAYFIVDSELECKKREYLVKFTLDKKGYLDDVDVKMIKEENYENKDKEIGYRVFYINSNWDGLSLTENFRKKFNSSKGIFPDIELLGYNFDFDSNSEEYEQITIEGIAKINQIRKFKINNIFQYYLYQVFKDENGNTDNVIYEKLPYVNIMSIEEAKELYLKENKE